MRGREAGAIVRHHRNGLRSLEIAEETGIPRRDVDAFLSEYLAFMAKERCLLPKLARRCASMGARCEYCGWNSTVDAQRRREAASRHAH